MNKSSNSDFNLQDNIISTITNEGNFQSRTVGRFVVKAFLIFGAVGGSLVLFGYGVFTLNYALELSSKIKNILGYKVTSGQIDMIGASVIGTFIFIPIILTLICYLKYQASWNKKAMGIWGDRSLCKKHSRLPSFSDLFSVEQRSTQEQYLIELANTTAWKAELSKGNVTDFNKTNLLAEELLRSIEKDIAERAITTGLIIGISSSRLIDNITIIITSLEIQMHVLSKLGRKPSIGVWYELLVRAGSSLFITDYLNRNDTFALTMTTKTIAAGMSYTASILDSDAAEEINEGLFDYAEEFLNRFATGDISGAIVNSVLTTSELATNGAMSIGSEGLNLMSRLVEKHGDDLLQGVLSGGMLYYHGMSIAADSLAIDKQHRCSPRMSRTPFACMNIIAQTAGIILLGYIRTRKEYIRKKKRDAIHRVPGVKKVINQVSKLKGLFTRRKNDDNLANNQENNNDVTVSGNKSIGGLSNKIKNIFGRDKVDTVKS
jgi:hypothetical protein